MLSRLCGSLASPSPPSLFSPWKPNHNSTCLQFPPVFSEMGTALTSSNLGRQANIKGRGPTGCPTWPGASDLYRGWGRCRFLTLTSKAMAPLWFQLLTSLPHLPLPQGVRLCSWCHQSPPALDASHSSPRSQSKHRLNREASLDPACSKQISYLCFPTDSYS